MRPGEEKSREMNGDENRSRKMRAVEGR